MTPELQEKLFKLVRKKFPRWSKLKASGYVHGVVNGIAAHFPKYPVPNGTYSEGYMYGYIDAYGEDALPRGYRRKLEYRWWDDLL